jgi:PhnB protein
MAVKPIPDGYHTVTPYVSVEGASGLLDFLQAAFGAVLRFKMEGPDGRVGHAEVQVGDSLLMVGEPCGQWGARPTTVYLYVPDVDATYRRALDAGATSLHEPTNQFYGDRSAGVKDAFGNFWWIATHVEDVAPDELERRAAEARKAWEAKEPEAAAAAV